MMHEPPSPSRHLTRVARGGPETVLSVSGVCRCDMCALLEVGKNGDHTVARCESTRKHRYYALAVAPGMLYWWKGDAREGG